MWCRMAELLRTSYDRLGNRVTFAWDSPPTAQDKLWALETFKKARGLRFVQKWHEWDPPQKKPAMRVDPCEHGFARSRC